MDINETTTARMAQGAGDDCADGKGRVVDVSRGQVYGTVDLTRAEIVALLAAIGGSLTGDPDDESAFVGSQARIRAAYRGQEKLRRALHPL